MESDIDGKDGLTRARARTLRLEWLHYAWAPFFVIAVTPLIAWPLAVLLFAPFVETPGSAGFDVSRDCTTYRVGCHAYAPVLPSFVLLTLPGVVNLLPLLWILRSPIPAARVAGWVAGGFGFVRFALPAVALLVGFVRVTSPTGGSYVEIPSMLTPTILAPHGGIWFAEWLIWVTGIVVWLGFTLVRRFSPAVAGVTMTAVILTSPAWMLFGYWTFASTMKVARPFFDLLGMSHNRI